jgi:hypothetical protein
VASRPRGRRLVGGMDDGHEVLVLVGRVVGNHAWWQGGVRRSGVGKAEAAATARGIDASSTLFILFRCM